MINELMIVNDTKTWLYYKTNQSNIKQAMAEFETKLEANGIDMSNMLRPTKIRLTNTKTEQIIEEKNIERT